MFSLTVGFTSVAEGQALRTVMLGMVKFKQDLSGSLGLSFTYLPVISPVGG